MSPAKSLSDFLLALPGIGDLSQRAHILLVAHYLRGKGQTHFSRRELAEAFAQGGLPAPAHLDVRLRQLCSGRTAALVRVDTGRLSLSIYGVQEVEGYLTSVRGIGPALVSLEKLVGRLQDDAERRFLAEAVACVQVGAKRAAVVMVWLLAVDHMQRYVLAHKLTEFNQALGRRPDHKGITISTIDDFGEIRDERTLIEVLRSAGIITKDIRRILDEKLGFRNTCAHPANIEIPDAKVVAAVEDLAENVVLKYPL